MVFLFIMAELPPDKYDYDPNAILDLYLDVPRPTSAEEVREEQGINNFLAFRKAEMWAKTTRETDDPETFALGILKGIQLYQNYMDKLREQPQ
jgi:hypothetical protein